MTRPIFGGKRGRVPFGSLEGETVDQRDARVRAWALANPHVTTKQIAQQLGLRVASAEKLLRGLQRAEEPRSPYLAPLPRFRPSLVPPTAEARIAAIAEDERDRIARQYGAQFKDVAA